MTAKPYDPSNLIRAACAALEGQLKMLETTPDKYFNACTDPQSPRLSDLAAMKLTPHKLATHQRRLWQKSNHLARLTMANLSDHGNALLQLLRSGDLPLFAHMTLARPTAEAAVIVTHLLDSNITYEERLIRGAALLLENARAQKTLSQDFPPDAQKVLGPAADAELKAIRSQISRGGITVELDKRGKECRLRLGAHAAPMKLEFTTKVATLFPRRPGAYRVASGAIHSSPRALNARVSTSTAAGVGFVTSLGEIGGAVTLVLEAIGIVLASYARYNGQTGEDEARVTRQRITIITGYMTEYFRFAATLGIS